MCVRRTCAALAEASAVYLYNGSVFKPWYLSGQVEVCCLMSSMWPQSGRCVVDRRLCPVSDWGLGLVTGPGLIGWLVPPQPAHTPSLWAREGAAAWGCEKPWRQGCEERLGGWTPRWIASPHTHTLVSLSVPRVVSASLTAMLRSHRGAQAPAG